VTVFADSPRGFCSVCLFKTGLGSLEDDNDRAQESPRIQMEFGEYELLQEIGRGGQGVVYRARQKSLNRTVALKVIGLGQWSSTPHLKRFRHEAEAAASLEHPQIVPIYEIGERDGSCYFSMKFVEGGRLDDVGKGDPMSARRAAELLVKIARTVQFAHEHGILHRDIKPGNILLDKNGEPHLTDFGLARLIEQESTITNSFEVLGTPSYMPPEQAAGHAQELTPAADVYSLGAVFYHMLTSEPPFAGGTTYETIRMVLESEPRNPRARNAKVDFDLATICLKCLEKDSTRRYQSAAALADDVERWLRHEPIQARRSGIFRRASKWVRRNPAITTLAAVILALAIVVGIMSWRTIGERLPSSGIAVLPFENLSDDKTDAAFVDGIQDDILTKLAKVSQLKVISRTSVMQYRGERNMRKIANALRVSHLLEGSVRKTGDRIHLNAQLIDARTDNHVWAEQYDRNLPDLFAIQSEIAQTIANRLSAKVSGAEKKAIEAEPTQDLEAYNLYLRAKELIHSTSTYETSSVEIYPRAIDLLEKAVARDPNFALAYCLLAEANLALYWKSESVLGTRERAEAALQAARRLAPNAGETYLAEALWHYWGNRDYDHAFESLEKAARSLPNSALVFSLTSRVERRLARWSEALRHGARAVELDPKDWQLRDDLIVPNVLIRYYAEAERAADRAMADFPEKADYFRFWKAQIALSKGDLKAMREILAGFGTLDREFWVQQWELASAERNWVEAEKVLNFAAQHNFPVSPRYPRIWFEAVTARAVRQPEKARAALEAARQHYTRLLQERRNDQPLFLAQLAIVDAMLGRKEEALQEAQRAVELLPSKDAVEGPRMVADLAIVYSLIGEPDHAIEQLSSVVKVASIVSYGELKFAPWWDELRSDPRFEQLMAEAAKPIPLN
jgi:TolB-like protein/predicted Ser/Thr protein kinase